jgi:hypothetical protein
MTLPLNFFARNERDSDASMARPRSFIYVAAAPHTYHWHGSRLLDELVTKVTTPMIFLAGTSRAKFCTASAKPALMMCPFHTFTSG